MTRDELLARLQQDEGPLLERKESPQQRTPITETLVGFANSTAPDQEAVLLIGQRGNKEIVGVEGVEAVQPTVRQWAEEQCYPPIPIAFAVLHEAVGPRGPVLAVIVKGSTLRPHFTGHSFVRVGSETKKASAQQLDELIASRNDKARLILWHKAQGHHVTVEVITRAYNKESHTLFEAEIEECTAQWVRVRHLGPGTSHSFSLERVALTDDPAHHRPLKVIVKPI